jgi:hypothetical protein
MPYGTELAKHRRSASAVMPQSLKSFPSQGFVNLTLPKASLAKRLSLKRKELRCGGRMPICAPYIVPLFQT